MPERSEVGSARRRPAARRGDGAGGRPGHRRPAARLVAGRAQPGTASSPALRARFGDRVRVVTYDARGHGRSSCMALRTATLAQLGDDLAAVLDAVAPAGPVVLVGHSHGRHDDHGVRAPPPRALRRPGRPGWSSSRPPPRGTRTPSTACSPRIARLIRLAETTGAGVLARCGAWRPPRAAAARAAPEPPLAALRRPLRPDRHPAGHLGGGPRLAALDRRVPRLDRRPAPAGHPRPRSATCRPPRWSATGTGSPRRRAPSRSPAALPGTELTVCPGAGHMLMMERPDEVNAALAGVLRRVLAARPAGAARRPRGPPGPAERVRAGA